MPFDEDYDCGYSIDDRHGNKSEVSGSRSRSRRHHRSKSEDVHERRKYDEQSEELAKIAKNLKAKKKKRIRVRLGSLTRIDQVKVTPFKKNLQIETQEIENEYQEMLF